MANTNSQEANPFTNLQQFLRKLVLVQLMADPRQWEEDEEILRDRFISWREIQSSSGETLWELMSQVRCFAETVDLPSSDVEAALAVVDAAWARLNRWGQILSPLGNTGPAKTSKPLVEQIDGLARCEQERLIKEAYNIANRELLILANRYSGRLASQLTTRELAKLIANEAATKAVELLRSGKPLKPKSDSSKTKRGRRCRTTDELAADIRLYEDYLAANRTSGRTKQEFIRGRYSADECDDMMTRLETGRKDFTARRNGED